MEQDQSGRVTLYIILGVVLVLLGIGGYASYGGNGEAYEKEVVRRTNLNSTIEFSGVVVPAQEVDLSFEVTGKVSNIYAEIGDVVAQDESLVALDDRDAQINFLQAKSNLLAEEARLSELLRGTREEELVIQQSEVAQRQQSLMDTEQALYDVLLEGYIVADNALRNNIDELFTDPRTSTPDLVFTTAYIAREGNLETERGRLNDVLEMWNEELTAIRSAQQVSGYDSRYLGVFARGHVATVLAAVNEEVIISDYIQLSRSNLTSVKTFLDDLAFLVNVASSPTETQATIASWKTDVSTARTNVITALQELSTQEKTYNAAKTALSVEQDELLLLEAGSSDEVVAKQRATVAREEALVAEFERAIEKHTLRAPFEGVVVMQELEVGEIVAQREVVVRLNSDATFEIDADVSELDIGALREGLTAAVALDAYPGERFAARIAHIDPAETLISNTPTYGVTLLFEEEDSRIRSGMTTTVLLNVVLKEDILAVPARALEIRNGNLIVQVETSEGIVESAVVTGLRDTNGFVEIREGLSEGDRILVRP